MIYVLIILNYIFLPNLNAHSNGQFPTKEDALLKAKELGCEGSFQIKELWMPCANEAELHQFLMNE
tara:strand:+ start:484 stop:681 length:198 start_codon:yes stop_codon:yes gene_type:complete